MNALTHSIQEARHVLTEAKIALRDAKEALGDYETALAAGVNYTALGPNKEARELALAEIKRTDGQRRALAVAVRTASDHFDRAETDLECLFDERREQENVTWAKLTDYLLDQVDHVHHAPTQATRHSAKVQAIDAATRKMEATRQAAQAPLPDGGNGDEPPEMDEECPF
jgi:hypothetical protein